MVASAKIDPDTLERLRGQREEIDALRRKVEALRREVEALRGVRNGPRRVNGAN
jgi:polyhydroxyalkanoate synthesis regulator phasin